MTVLLYDADGELRADSSAALRRSGGPDVADPRRLPDRPTEVDDVEGGLPWRVLAADTASGGTLVAAVPLSGVAAMVSRLVVINAAVGLLALAGGGALAAWAVRRGLRPLRRVEETAEAIAAGDLSVRVPAADPRTEVGSLSASFNAMVDRFETAWSAQQRSEAQARASEARMRQFVADASHELRTPLTSIRGFAELYRQGAARDPEQLGGVMRRIEDEAARMGLLVEDLLLLARLDQARPLRFEPVDLLSVATDVGPAAATVHGAHHVVRLRADTGEGLPVVLGDHVVLEVRDDGEGMAPEVAARAFERFYRADASCSRASSSTGSGLGLSIVAAIVAAHGGTVDVDTAPGAGSCLTVRLPAADPQGVG